MQASRGERCRPLHPDRRTGGCTRYVKKKVPLVLFCFLGDRAYCCPGDRLDAGVDQLQRWSEMKPSQPRHMALETSRQLQDWAPNLKSHLDMSWLLRGY